MLEEFPKKVSREPLLTQEQRMKLTRENRAKSKPKRKVLPAKPRLGPEEAAKRERKYRLARSTENRRKAEAHRNPEAQAAAASPQVLKADAVVESSVDAAAAQLDVTTESEHTEAAQPAFMVTRTRRAKETDPAASAHDPLKARMVRGNRFTDRMKPRYVRKRASVWKAAALGVGATLLVGMVIYGRVQTNEVYSEIAKAQTQYDDTLAKNVSMHSEMEGKMTVKNVAEYAETVLGLKQLDQSQIQYIQIQTEDEVTIAEEDPSIFVTIRRTFLELWAFIKGE